ncbi:hypothetical protein BJ085DRAFT_4843, partial [Dimargaris cristalligena]
DANFIQNYYASSRLHHLSTFKIELQNYVIELRRQRGLTSESTGSARASGRRCIMYVDFDCFFVAVGLRSRPDLRGKPVAVSHCQNPSEASSSDIASCNYEARAAGVSNGMVVGRARQLCPNLIVIPYEFEQYREASRTLYQILVATTPQVQVGGMDEAILDVTNLINDQSADKGAQTKGVSRESVCAKMAESLRQQVWEATQCQVSVGISENILLAKLATRWAKPHGQYYLPIEDAPTRLAPLPVKHIPGIGETTARKLADAGITTIRDLRNQPLARLQDMLGPKAGLNIQRMALGQDDRPLVTSPPRHSVGTEIGWGVRFETPAQVDKFLRDLCQEVHTRMATASVRGKSVTLRLKRRQEGAGEARKHLGHGLCDNFSKSATLPQLTREADALYQTCSRLLGQLAVPPVDLRAVGIQVQKL